MSSVHHGTPELQSLGDMQPAASVEDVRSEIELEVLRSQGHEEPSTEESGFDLVEAESNIVASFLPPADRGPDAWHYLAGAFVVEGLTWGFMFSYGVFQNNFNSQERFRGNKSLALVGTSGTGVTFIGAPILVAAINRFPHKRHAMMYAGLGLCVSSMVLAGFCNEVWQLICTQGIMYGLGTLALYSPVIALLNEWFVEKRGFATGVCFAATGMFGLGLPLMFEKLLSSIGYANSLRLWAIVLTITVTPTIRFLVKVRIPPSSTTTQRRLDLSAIKSLPFVFITLSNFLQALGYFIPGIYLPSYATDLNLGSIQSTIVLSLFNIACVFSTILLGHLGDRMGSRIPMLISTCAGALSVCFLWGFSKSFGLLIAFSIIYGLSAGGYSVLWSTFSAEMTQDPITQLNMWSLFAFERGIGNIIAGPISASLVKMEPMISSYAIGKYEGMILFTGITMLASTVGIMGTKHMQRKAT